MSDSNFMEEQKQMFEQLQLERANSGGDPKQTASASPDKKDESTVSAALEAPTQDFYDIESEQKKLMASLK